DHSLQQPQGLDALVSAAIPHQGKREAVFRGDRDSLEQRRKDVRRGDEIGVPGPAPLQIEQQGRELIRRDGHRSPPFEGELPGLAALAGEIAAGDQHQAGGHELRLLAVVDPGPGEPEPVALLADAGRPARAIDTAEVRAEIAAGVMRAGLRGAVVQLARREPHTGLTCPRGTTSRAPPETQRSCPMQCEEASLESQSAACTRRLIFPSFSWALRTASTQPRSLPSSACTATVPGGGDCVRCCAQTRTPCCKSAWAMPRPMPLEAPVTRAVRPSRSG